MLKFGFIWNSVDQLVNAGMFLFYCTRLKRGRRNGRVNDVHKLFYILTFWLFVHHITTSSQQMLLFIRKRLFIECHIYFYAVIYVFIEQWRRKNERSIKREKDFFIYLLFLWIIKVDGKRRFQWKSNEGYWSLNWACYSL